MANDMLGRRLGRYAGSFSTDDTQLTFPNLPNEAGYLPYLVTNVGVQYQQQVSRIYSLNDGNIALAAGRPQGNAQLQQVLSPLGSFQAFYSTYGKVCNAKGNTLQFDINASCDETTAFAHQAFTRAMATIVQFGVNVAAQDGIINNNIAIQFESLAYTNQ
jgi:hypothetical protein